MRNLNKNQFFELISIFFGILTFLGKVFDI